MEEEGISSDLGFVHQTIHVSAQLLGFSDSTLRFFISVLIGYLLAFIPRNLLHHASSNIQHLFFIALGLGLSYFNFGMQTLHFVITVLFNYLLLAVAGGSVTSVVLSFLWNMIYFLIGTVSISDGTHDVLWDTPHCIMVLKVIGVALDLYDGQKSKDKLSAEQQQHYLTRAPSLLEMGGFCLFFGGFLAGPQFSMRLYLDYTNNRLIPEWEQKHPSNARYSINRFCFGVIYVCVGVGLNLMMPDAHFMTEEFTSKNLLHKLFTVYLWGTSYRARYGGVFLLAEGASIMTGIAYSGLDTEGKAEWKGSANMNVYGLETAGTFRGLVSNYNTNTSKWAGRCVYKRLKFLGNRQLSQFVTLMFLALWHGVYIGYFHCFLFQLFTLTFDEQWLKVWRKLGFGSLMSNPVIAFLMTAICNVFVMTSFSYALISFQLSKWGLFTQVYASMYYIGHVWFIGWMLLFPLVLQPMLHSNKPKATGDSKAQ
ncbi:lysophospholipid acyltransferase 5 [Strongylocentrotus purpuratus]|uniref:Lysophospholipid acyltransferase 5 n=1 Tax=Strongylocentrotus purpuratus TaxID=7668 RepID=A0A7M7NXS3_STRPU|nr:lysophospholipid acyltransferase 5 [Strongylocentrotus purpuratus]